MTEIIDHINASIESCIENVLTYSLCHLIEDDSGEQYPSLIASEGNKITPNDQHTVLIYHRFLNGDYSPNEELSFGRSVTAHNQQIIRTVIIIDIDEDLSIIDDIVNALPDDFELDEYELVSVSKNVNLIRDSNSVWSQEFSEAYKDKYIKRYNVYALEYQVQYVKCNTCSVSSVNSEYQLVLDTATLFGYTLPSSSTKIALRQFIENLKEDGIFDLLDALFVYATDGDSDFASINIKDPSGFKSTRVGVPIFQVMDGFYGWTTPPTGCIDTNFIPSKGINFTQDNSSFIIGIINDYTASVAAHGCGGSFAQHGVLIQPKYSVDTLNIRMNSSVTYSISNSDASGFYHSKRTSSTNVEMFKNGALLSSDTITSTGLSVFSVLIEGINNNGIMQPLSENGVSIVAFGASLDGLEAAFYNHWNTYLSSL